MRTRTRGLIATVLGLLVLAGALSQAPAVMALIATETKLTASDAAAGDRFGGRLSTSLSVSGDALVIGAYLADVVGESSGAAYVFNRDGGIWTEQAKLVPSDAADGDLFGQAVALDGDAIIVGSFFDDDLGSHSGSAYIFRRSGSVWSEEAKLLAGDGAGADQFGFSVSMSGNVVVVGAPFDDDAGLDSGSAYVYRWNGANWVQEAKLTPNDGAAGDLFGYSVAVDGSTAVVGAQSADAPEVDSGATYVFQWNGSAWTQEAKLVASEGEADDRFGFSVALSADTAVVGAFHEGVRKSHTGAAYVFQRVGATWSEEAKLTASDGSRKDFFGIAVSVDGDLALVGATLGDGSGKDTGAAYVYQRTGTVWSEELKLTASDGAKGDSYGEAVSIDGNVAMVGSPKDDDAGSSSGAVYVYDLT